MIRTEIGVKRIMVDPAFVAVKQERTEDDIVENCEEVKCEVFVKSEPDEYIPEDDPLVLSFHENITKTKTTNKLNTQFPESNHSIKKETHLPQPNNTKQIEPPVIHQCEYCDKIYPTYNGLAQHLSTHKGSKPYQCQYCERQFSVKISLVKHCERRTKSEHYDCPACNKVFPTKACVRHHSLRHDNEKIYQCEICHKRFSFKRFARHKKHHIASKKYQCEHCKKAFVAKHDYLRHLRTHTMEKPYTCPKCGKSFARKWGVTEHLKGVHKLAHAVQEDVNGVTTSVEPFMRVDVKGEPVEGQGCNELLDD